MNKKKVLFMTLEALADGNFMDITDYKLRKSVLDKLRSMENLYKIVVVYNQMNTGISRIDFNSTARSIGCFLASYTNKAVDFRFADWSESGRRQLPNVWLLEEAAMAFPALLGGKDCWSLVGVNDKEIADNFGIDYIELKDFTTCDTTLQE